MYHQEKILPDEFHELEKMYAVTKSLSMKLEILGRMLELIPKGEVYNKVRTHTSHKMRLIREKIAAAAHRDEAVRKSRAFFKDDLFSIVLFGDANAGKTYLLNQLTGSSHSSTPQPFETKDVLQGVFEHAGARLRLVELPSAVKPEHGRVLREADLIILMPDSERYLDYLDDFEVETPLVELSEYPVDTWSFLELVVVELRGEPLVVFQGATLSDLDLDSATVNDKEEDGSYILKDGDVIV